MSSRGKRPSRIACDTSGKAPEISACDAMTVAAVASATIGISSQSGASAKNSLSLGMDPAESISALPEVVEEKRRVDDGEPGDPDRQNAEMADVGVHRFAAGNDQHQSAQDQEGIEEIRASQELKAVKRIEGGENLRGRRDLSRAEDRNGDEPGEHDRPKHLSNAGGAFELDGEQGDEKPERDRNDRA